MKKLTVLLVAILMLGGSLATSSQAAIEVEGDVYAGIWDKYLWRGFDLSDGRPTIQAGIDLVAGGWGLSTWHNFQLASSDELRSGEMNETDLILSYNFDVMEEMVSIVVGDIYYSLDFRGAEDTNELFLHATLNTMLAPTFKIWWDWDAAEDDGLFYTLDVSYSYDPSQWVNMPAINLGALVAYNQHSDYSVGDFSGFHNYELSASLDFPLSDQITISPIAIFSSGISSAAKDAIDTETAFALNMTFTF